MSNNTRVYFDRDFHFDSQQSRSHDWAKEQLLAMRKISQTVFVEDTTEEVLIIFTDDNDSIVTVRDNVFDVLDLSGVCELIVDNFDLSDTRLYAIDLDAKFKMTKIK